MNTNLATVNDEEKKMIPFTNFENYLQTLGLPFEGIIASETERKTMGRMLPATIIDLAPEIKQNASYLSKFVASASIGLHDAALNYIWNEVVISLRTKVNIYGLDLFYDVAVGGQLRETYNTFEDLSSIKDNILVDTCRKLELISDVLHQKLKHILFMRNHIGASHPNTESIRSLELLGWLQTCVIDIIADKPSEAALYVQQLINNLKNEDLELNCTRLDQIEEHLKIQNTGIPSNLLITLFGIFTKKNTSPNVRVNILKLAPIIWNLSVESKKYEIGFKLDQFSLNLDEDLLALSERFLEKCEGFSYKSEGTKSRELNDLLDRLLDAHSGYDNFHHEVPIIRQINKYISGETDILPNIEDKLIKTILICRIGNGNWYCQGVSPNAKQIYNNIIILLNSKQINKLIKFLRDPEIRNILNLENCITQTISIFNLINMDLQDGRTKEIIEYIKLNLNVQKHNIFNSKTMQDLMKHM